MGILSASIYSDFTPEQFIAVEVYLKPATTTTVALNTTKKAGMPLWLQCSVFQKSDKLRVTGYLTNQSRAFGQPSYGWFNVLILFVLFPVESVAFSLLNQFIRLDRIVGIVMRQEFLKLSFQGFHE